MNRVVVFAGDDRQAYLAKIFKDLRYDVHICSSKKNITLPWDVKNITISNFVDEEITWGEIFLAPMRYEAEMGNEILPFKTGQIVFGGNIPENIREYCDCNQVKYYDYQESEEILTKNAEPTALGATIEAISTGGGILGDKECLVIGYGRCGKCLAEKLQNLHHAIVTVMVRREDVIRQVIEDGYQAVDMNSGLDKYNYIFNTVPSCVLSKDRLTMINEHAIVIDIAAYPGGTDFEYCIEHNINAKLCPGIPGRQFPKTAAIILYEYIEHILKNQSQTKSNHHLYG